MSDRDRARLRRFTVGGDNLASWRADWFDPAAAALPVAPWLFVRGNHENCDRGGDGWFRYLAAGPMPAECQQFSPPWAVDIDARSFLILDTSATADVTTTPQIDAAFKPILDQLAEMTTPGVWLLTHKPLAGGLLKLSGKSRSSPNATLQSLTKGALPPGIGAVVAGHIHLAEALSFERAAAKPFQIIAGNSGTLLDAAENATYTGAALGDPLLNTGIVGAEFGWTAVELDQDQALVTAFRLDGASFFRISLLLRVERVTQHVSCRRRRHLGAQGCRQAMPRIPLPVRWLVGSICSPFAKGHRLLNVSLRSDPNATRFHRILLLSFGWPSPPLPGSDDACADSAHGGLSSALRTATKPSPSRSPRSDHDWFRGPADGDPQAVLALPSLIRERAQCALRSAGQDTSCPPGRSSTPPTGVPVAMAHCTSPDDETRSPPHPPAWRWRRCT